MSPNPVFSFALQEFLGFHIETVDGESRATLELGHQHQNPHGVAHGAVPFTLMDTVMGAVVMSTIEPGNICATIEMHTRFIASAKAGTLTATARVTSAGRRVVHTEARTMDSTGRLVASATASFAVIAPRS